MRMRYWHIKYVDRRNPKALAAWYHDDLLSVATFEQTFEGAMAMREFMQQDGIICITLVDSDNRLLA